MNIQILLTSKDVEHLKQKARKLKQEEGITHTQALDKIAQRAKFNHWHHVCESYKRIEPTETAYRSGVIIAMDIKDADDFYDEENLFVEDEYGYFCPSPRKGKSLIFLTRSYLLTHCFRYVFKLTLVLSKSQFVLI